MLKQTLFLITVMLGLMSQAMATTATLVYTGNLDGELEPCGCSAEGNFGGIKRQSTMIAQLRKQRPELVFISSGGMLTSESTRDRLKSEYILKGVVVQGFDAIGMQWRDLAYGEDFIKLQGLPWVVSNWENPAEFPPQRAIQRTGARFAVFSWLDPDQSPMKLKAEGYRLINDKVGPLRESLVRARKAGQTTVLTTTLTLKQAQQRLPLREVDILLIRSNYENPGQPQRVGKTLVLQPGSRGMRFAQVDLTLERGGRVKAWRHKVLPMPGSVADDPALEVWYQEYNDKVKLAYEAEVAMKQKLLTAVSPYVGAGQCASCHQAQHEIWEQTHHAAAFGRLEEVGKAFDPDCIVCHSVGFEMEGGFIDPGITPELMNVQCESCHGAGRQHVEAQGKLPLPNANWPRQQICAQCHTPAHSPSFNFDSYWPRIAH